MIPHKPTFEVCRNADGTVEMLDGLPAIRLRGELRYLHTDGSEIVIPPSFRGNGGSVPYPVRWLVHPHDEYALHAFHLHDWNYSARRITRRQADRILFYSLRCSGVSLVRATLVWLAVRAFGSAHY